MAKTYQNVIDEARTLLQDSVAPFRYTEAVLLSKLNRALNELGRLRPEAFWDRYDKATSDILIPEVVVTDPVPDTDPEKFNALEEGQVPLSDAFEPSMQFYGPVVYFITASAEIIDDEFADDGRASMLMAQFKQQVVSM